MSLIVSTGSIDIAQPAQSDPGTLARTARQDIVRVLNETGRRVALVAPKFFARVDIERTDSTYAFPSGTSRAALFTLTAAGSPQRLILSSLCNCKSPSRSIFVPSIALFDDRLNETRLVDERELVRHGDRIMAEIGIAAGSLDRYVLVFTREELIGQVLGTQDRFAGLLFAPDKYPILAGSFGRIEVELKRKKS